MDGTTRMDSLGWRRHHDARVRSSPTRLGFTVAESGLDHQSAPSNGSRGREDAEVSQAPLLEETFASCIVLPQELPESWRDIVRLLRLSSKLLPTYLFCHSRIETCSLVLRLSYKRPTLFKPPLRFFTSFQNQTAQHDPAFPLHDLLPLTS